MVIVDKLLGWLLVAIGCIHNFVAAPVTYGEFSIQALWFVSAGLALWFAGFINLLRAASSEPTMLLLVFCLLTNVSLLMLLVAFVALQDNWAAPDAVALVTTVAILTGISVVSMRKAGRSNKPPIE